MNKDGSMIEENVVIPQLNKKKTFSFTTDNPLLQEENSIQYRQIIEKTEHLDLIDESKVRFFCLNLIEKKNKVSYVKKTRCENYCTC